MSAGSQAPALVPTIPIPPPVSSLELERVRREVKVRLFGGVATPPTIDRYQIIGCIGQGGMGIVYAARDERLGRTVALKLLRPELSRTGHSSLAVEAQALAKLSHPNVVAVFDVGEHDGQVFVAMEYVEGDSLRRWLETPRELAAILDVYIAAGEGLAAAHAAGLVHRDFKPDNVLVATDGRPRILDFGLARAPEPEEAGQPPSFAADAEATATSVSQYGVLLGTPAYMAPEQHLGERADARSDQFGFCVALYQAVYATLPFPSEDLRALSLAIVTGRCTPPPTQARVPERLRRAILRGLSVERDARFADIATLLAELREIRALLDQPAPARADAPAPNFDTRAIERAFGVAGRSAGPPSDRPSLSEAEVREIADEVGLDLREIAEADAEAEAPRLAPRPKTSVDGRPDPIDRDQTYWMASTIMAERALSSLPGGDAQRRIVRELERNLGGTGIVEQFDAGMTWANREAEVSIDRSPTGAQLTVRRSFSKLARKRRRRGLILGWFLGTVLGGVSTDLLGPALTAIEPLLVFGGMGVGMLFGAKFARVLHERHMHAERALLTWVGERVEALTSADDPSRMLEAGTAAIAGSESEGARR